MSLAFIGGLTLAYCGMLALCQGVERHYKQFWGVGTSAVRLKLLRVIGWLALLSSFFSCVMAWGWAMGPVGWLGMCSLAGLVLVLLLPYAPRLSTWLPVAGMSLMGMAGWFL